MRPFLSLCMIVKNEEKVINRCLSSVAHLVNEIIIVDTGSTDSTKEIVAKYTKNVFDYKWDDDFSSARNFAASKASGEWILVLDADEYIDEENFKEFVHEIAQNDDIDTYTAKILNFTGNFGENLIQNFHDRIYKNNGEICYYRKIHEQFKNIKGKTLINKRSSLVIFHSGYLSQTVSEKNKKVRNQELLDKEMKDGNNKAFDYFNYGNEYSSIGEYSKALNSYLEAYKQKKDFQLAWVSTTLVQIIMCLINLHRFDDALRVINDAEKIYSNSPEIPFLKGEIFMQRYQLEDAKIMFLQIVNSNNYNNIIIRPDLKDQRPHLRLGEIYLYQKKFHEAIYHFTSVININKYNTESINKIIYIFNKFQNNNEITNFLKTNNLIDDNNLKYYINACFEVGNILLALQLIKEYPDNNNDILYKISSIKLLCINTEKQDLKLDKLINERVENLHKTNLLNVVDIVLLKEIIKKNIILESILEPYEYNQDVKTLESLLKGENIVFNENTENVFLFSLQKFINYKNVSKCSLLLENIKTLNNEVIAKVADLLYKNDFKKDAISIYNDIEWEYLKENDYINIIENLLEADDISNAIQISKYANIIFKNDFRFYEFILTNSNQIELVMNTLNIAKKRFKYSKYLEKFNE